MSRKDKFFLIAVVLLTAGLMLLFRLASGPFYFGTNSDPSYLYFYNFLYILEGKSPQFVDHPGTPLDILGAMTVKIFFPALPNTSWLAADAPKAESVLNLVWFFMMVSFTATLGGLGAYVLNKSKGRVFTALVLMGSLWLLIVRSFTTPGQGILPISANVNSDTMMMTADNLMLWAILRFYFSPKPRAWLQAVSLGAAVAFAIATKFTALPFIVVAWCVLISWPQRILLLMVVAAGFAALTFPIWGSYSHMITWVKGLIMARGMHGSGGEGFNAPVFLSNFIHIVEKHWFFVLAWVLAGLTALLSRRTDNKIRRILGAVAAGGLMQILLVAKQDSYQYMAPMIGLTPLVFALAFEAFPRWWSRGMKTVVLIILVISLGTVVLSLWQVNQTTRKTWDMLNTISKDYPQCRVCPFYRSSMPGFAFVFWNRILFRDDYSAVLKADYPDLVYYDIFASDFKDSAQRIVPLTLLKAQNPCVLAYGSDDRFENNLEPGLTARKILANGVEALYEVQSVRSNLGGEYLQYAKILYAQGRYKDAFQAAQVAQALGTDQDLSGLITFLRQKI